MKSILRMRHYCDHCKKSGGSAKWMLRHEEGCTKNPARKCRMCDLLPDVEHAPLAELLTTLAAEGFQAMRAKAGECPACILAALRQETAIPEFENEAQDAEFHRGRGEFNFKAEMTEIWKEINAHRSHEGYY